MRKISNMEELRMAQIELRHRRALKEMELQAHSNAIKEMLNPMTYINLAISKIAFVEQLAASFVKGYTVVKEMLHRQRDSVKEDPPTPDNQ